MSTSRVKFCAATAVARMLALFLIAASSGAMAQAVSLTMSGRVTSSSTGLGIAAIRVEAILDNHLTGQWATSDGDGYFSYTFSATPGTYRFHTTVIGASYYLNQAYPNVLCVPFCNNNLLLGQPFDVQTAQTINNLDFSLDIGGRVSGTLSADGSGLPLANIGVILVDPIGGRQISAGSTNAAGAYVSAVVPSVNYKIVVNRLPGYAGEVYNNHECAGSCDPAAGDDVVVAAGGLTLVNISLRPTVTVRGRLTDSQGNPRGGSIRLYTAAGDALSGGYTDSDGNYGLLGSSADGAVPPGNYAVFAIPDGNFIPAVYPGIDCGYCDKFTTGTHITVGSQTLNGVDIVVHPGATVSGTISYLGLAPTGSLGTAQSIWTLDGRSVTAASNVSGSCCTLIPYSIIGLEPGDYRIAARYFTYSQQTGALLSPLYVGDLYSAIPCYFDSCNPAQGTPIHVNAVAAVTGIDFQLHADAIFKGGLE
ncbi:MAG: carboxypeptidase-like regulatory domain-containing protein [Tahibacter sp.]